MRLADWIVLAATLTYVVLYGLWRGRGCKNISSYLLANNSMPWHAMALSIMATQASAVTFISTTGQSYVDGMRFVQFYFGLPLAMILISMVIVPLFHRAKVYTAYEYLEQRFDAKTRALVSVIFLIQRGLALGITLYAPAVVLTVIFGWQDWITTMIMGGIAVVFTTLGGAKALAWSHFQQMAVMVIGLVAALLCAVLLLPDHVSFFDAVNLAGAAGRLNPITTNFDWNDRYNLWSGLFGGMFLALAYFGTDQSQVQRYLSGSSIAQSRLSLLFNAVAKIPMQFFILFIGAMVFVFYVYQQPPILFDRTEVKRLESPRIQADYAAVAKKYDEAFLNRRSAADGLIEDQVSTEQYAWARSDFGAAQVKMDAARREASTLIEKAGGKKVNDTNYIFLTFVTQYLPAGLVGLVLAVILGATMSSISSEMNSLATVTFIDIFQRHLWKAAPERHHLFASKAATVFWGVYAVITAQYVKRMGSLIEAVNVLGSFFYGGMLGVFVLACFFPNVRGRGAFWGVLLGEAAVFACWYFTTVAFLWYNVLGCVVVVVSGLIISGFDSKPNEVRPATQS